MKNVRWNPTTLIKNTAIAMAFVFIAWMLLSWVEIVVFNTSADPMSHYGGHNLIVNIFSMRG